MLFQEFLPDTEGPAFLTAIRYDIFIIVDYNQSRIPNHPYYRIYFKK